LRLRLISHLVIGFQVPSKVKKKKKQLMCGSGSLDRLLHLELTHQPIWLGGCHPVGPSSGLLNTGGGCGGARARSGGRGREGEGEGEGEGGGEGESEGLVVP
jgi:hypothetical protein